MRAAAALLLLLPACAPRATPVSSAPPAAVREAARGKVVLSSVPDEKKLRAANGWNGSYRNLLLVLHVPEDEASYSAFSEYGYREATQYRTFGAVPAGWWVYVAPYWFVWDVRDGQRGEAGPGVAIPTDGKLPAATPETRHGLVDPATLPAPVMLRAAVGKTAKYTNVLASIYDPADAKSYTAFSEQGWKDGGPHKGYGQLPAGYWVYVEPYWLIWNLKDGRTGPE